jgi:amino acid adenylation domain-containing protein
MGAVPRVEVRASFDEVSPVDIAASDAEEPAYIIYTSGSTGDPKGVVVSNRNLWHSISARLDYYEGGYPRFLLLSPLTFDSAHAGIWGTLCHGDTLHVRPDYSVIDAAETTAAASIEGVTHLLTVPSLYRVLVPRLQGSPTSSLRAVIMAGEELDLDLVQEHRQSLPRVAMFNEYGPSEATVWATVADVGHQSGEVTDGVSMGSAVAGACTLILDQSLTGVAPGTSGELYIGGDGVALGYHDDAAETARRFVPNPYAVVPGDATRLYRTGDVVRQAGHGLIFVGRTDHQIKIRGCRIEPEEIERAFRDCFDVADVMAGVAEDSDGRKTLCVYYERRNAAPLDVVPDLRSVRTELARVLPAYALPDAVAEAEQLPRLSNHKLDRRSVPMALSRPAPCERTAAASAVERALLGQWRDALDGRDLGVTDVFFDVGGDSLAANQIVLRTERLFGITLSIAEFFGAPTVRAQALALEKKAALQRVDIERLAAIWNEMDEA